jgi:hypothetical protein
MVLAAINATTSSTILTIVTGDDFKEAPLPQLRTQNPPILNHHSLVSTLILRYIECTLLFAFNLRNTICVCPLFLV